MTGTGGLWAAVDILVSPVRHKIVRDDESVEWTTIASLWDQLVQSVAVGSELHSKAKPGSRPPVATEALSLRLEIEGTISDALMAWKVGREHAVPKDLRHLAGAVARLGDEAHTAAWTEKLEAWAGQIRLTIGERQPSRRLRGVGCVECGYRKIRSIEGEGPEQRTILLDVLMQEYASDGDLRAIVCQHCQFTYWRGDDLHRLADGQATLRTPAPRDGESLSVSAPE
jgi:hypothetical protein